MAYGSHVLDSLTDGGRAVVAAADGEARQLGHPHVGTEHLLLGLLADEASPTARMLAAAGATFGAARHKVAEAVASRSKDRVGRAAAELPFTSRANRALERAARFAFQRKAPGVEPKYILLGVLDVEGTAGQVLRGMGVDVGRLRTTVEDDEAAAERPSSGTVAEGVALKCGACGVALEGSLSHRVVTSADESGTSRKVAVVYCSACGTAVGAHITRS